MGAGRWGDTPGPEGSTPRAHAAKDTTESGEERNEYWYSHLRGTVGHLLSLGLYAPLGV
jgi:hypothetical protein